MPKPRWLLALPLALAAWVMPATASEIRDDGEIFSADAVRRAQAELDRIERETKVPVTIETIPSLEAVTSQVEKSKWHSKKAAEVIDLVAQRNAREGNRKGLYILIDKKSMSSPTWRSPRSSPGSCPSRSDWRSEMRSSRSSRARNSTRA